MTAYLIAHRREIVDPETLRAYDGVDATLAKFGGRVVVRSDGFDVLEGEWRTGRSDTDARPERVTVIEFPDKASLRRWYNSADYAALKQLRQRASRSDMVAVEAV